MRIRIKSPDCRLFLPIPEALVGFTLRVLPESAFSDLQRSVPEGLRPLVSRKNARALWGECREVLREYKGLEVVHVEAGDGTYISIRL